MMASSIVTIQNSNPAEHPYLFVTAMLVFIFALGWFCYGLAMDPQ